MKTQISLVLTFSHSPPSSQAHTRPSGTRVVWAMGLAKGFHITSWYRFQIATRGWFASARQGACVALLHFPCRAFFYLGDDR